VTRVLLAFLWKDLVLEFRTGQRLLAVAGFAVMTGVLAHYSVAPSGIAEQDLASLLLWLAVLFSGTLGIGRTFELEGRGGAWAAVLHTPVSRPALFLAKVLSNLRLVLVLVGIVAFVFGLFFGVDFLAVPPAFWLAVGLGCTGFVATGTLLSAVTVQSSMGGTLLPLLLFPLLVPVVVFGATATSRLLAGLAASSVSGELRLLAAFALLSLVTGALLFGQVVDEG